MKNDSSYLAAGGLFDVAMLSLVAIGALGVRYDLAIVLWVAFLGWVVHRLRSPSAAKLPNARVVADMSGADRGTN